MTVHPAVQAAADEHRYAYLERMMTPPDPAPLLPDELVLIARAVAALPVDVVWEKGDELDGGNYPRTCRFCGCSGRVERITYGPRKDETFISAMHLASCVHDQAVVWVAKHPSPPPAALSLHLSGTLEAES